MLGLLGHLTIKHQPPASFLAAGRLDAVLGRAAVPSHKLQKHEHVSIRQHHRRVPSVSSMFDLGRLCLSFGEIRVNLIHIGHNYTCVIRFGVRRPGARCVAGVRWQRLWNCCLAEDEAHVVPADDGNAGARIMFSNFKAQPICEE